MTQTAIVAQILEELSGLRDDLARMHEALAAGTDTQWAAVPVELAAGLLAGLRAARLSVAGLGRATATADPLAVAIQRPARA